jgi:hypothetical protein
MPEWVWMWAAVTIMQLGWVALSSWRIRHDARLRERQEKIFANIEARERGDRGRGDAAVAAQQPAPVEHANTGNAGGPPPSRFNCGNNPHVPPVVWTLASSFRRAGSKDNRS